MTIPAGMSSEANLGDTKLFVQTEFAQRPKPRVTTTVTLNGQVVEKVENVWERVPETEEEKEKIEKFLKRQHQQVIEKIREKEEKMVLSEFGSCGSEKETTIFDINQTVHTSEDVWILKAQKELSTIGGVLEWIFIFDDEERMIYQTSEGSKVQKFKSSTKKDETLELVQRIKDISLFLPSVVKLGKFVRGILNLPGSSMLILPSPRGFLAVRLEPKVDFEQVVKKIKSIN